MSCTASASRSWYLPLRRSTRGWGDTTWPMTCEIIRSSECSCTLWGGKKAANAHSAYKLKPLSRLFWQVRKFFGNPMKCVRVSRGVYLTRCIVLSYMSPLATFFICFISFTRVCSLSGVLETLCDAYAVLLRQQVPEIIREATNGYLQVGKFCPRKRQEMRTFSGLNIPPDSEGSNTGKSSWSKDWLLLIWINIISEFRRH